MGKFDTYWIIIESVINNKNISNSDKYKTMITISNILPCNKCKKHFKIYLQNNKTINNEWLLTLKSEINKTQNIIDNSPNIKTTECCKKNIRKPYNSKKLLHSYF